jgi:hypothetical protein
MVRLTTHAKERQVRYGLAQAWIESAVMSPDWTHPDPQQPWVTRSFKVISESGGRVLRVAHRYDGADVLVLSAFFDRGAKP